MNLIKCVKILSQGRKVRLEQLHTFSIIALVTGVSGVYRMCPISMGLRKAQAMAPPVVLTMSKYMFMQKGAEDKMNHYTHK